MAIGDELIYDDKKGNRLFVSKDGTLYAYKTNGKLHNLNNLIIIVERAGFVIERIEKINGDVKLVLEDEAIEEDLK